MIDTKTISEEAVWKILETVADPEVPVLSIIDLGIVRKIEIYDAVTKPPSEACGFSSHPLIRAAPPWMLSI
jgi:metal-sulfur cluster biosynthetic enzyme